MYREYVSRKEFRSPFSFLVWQCDSFFHVRDEYTEPLNQRVGGYFKSSCDVT